MKRNNYEKGFFDLKALLVVTVALLFIAQGIVANNIVTKVVNQIDRIIRSDQTRNIQTGTIVLSPEGQVVAGSVKYGAFDIYSITLPSYSSLTLSFKLSSTSSNVTVYAKEGSMPTPYHFDFKISSPFESQTIDNSSSTIYITVYGESTNTNDYVLTAAVSTAVPGWIIGVIVASVIIGLLILLASFLIPVFICLGVCGCVCCAAAASNRPNESVNYFSKPRTYQNIE